MNDFFQQEIRNINRYREHIRKLFTKLKERKALFKAQQAGVNYFSFGLHETKLAKLLRNAIAHETYYFQPAKQRRIVVNHKARVIYDFELLDKLIVSVLMSILLELAETYLSNQVFSYRKGRRPLGAVKKLGHYINRQGLAAGQTKPECFILKTDIADYTDNIRLDKHSKLWQLLSAMLTKTNCTLTPYQQQLIEYCFRPEYIDVEGMRQCNIKGVPTGSVASTLAYNLYIAEIDHDMEHIQGLYYSRYSDDILLAHFNPAILSHAIAQLNQKLNDLGLPRKTAKDQALYLTKAGRNMADKSWLGTHKFTYLGYDIYANGTFIISTKRQRKWLLAIKKRITNVATLAHGKVAFAELGQILCRSINNALLDEDFGEQATKALLECNHIGMLKHLDYLIALSIAEVMSKQHGVKAFRIVSYKKIRTEWQLVSLVKLRTKLWH